MFRLVGLLLAYYLFSCIVMSNISMLSKDCFKEKKRKEFVLLEYDSHGLVRVVFCRSRKKRNLD